MMEPMEDPDLMIDALGHSQKDRDSLLDLNTVRKPVHLFKGKGVAEDSKTIMTSELGGELRPNLPPLLREASKWRLLYSLDHHGISLNTLYRKCEEEAGNAVMLAIKDGNGDVFGAFASEAFRVRPGYYGNGSCFLWKSENGQVKVFKATGTNDYLILSEPNFFALGGGEGHFGLWVDEDLYNGHSGRCQTFDNDQLSSTAEFDVVGLEIWAFDM
ncbi:oxidation resistance protein 1 [Blyttiomyces sp. JEL0837]|nr:oxidation resistance protein 1 [Blyttiomyces sp. JEL0837]